MGSAGMSCRPPDGLPAAACFRQESTLTGERNAPKTAAAPRCFAFRLGRQRASKTREHAVRYCI